MVSLADSNPTHAGTTLTQAQRLYTSKRIAYEGGNCGIVQRDDIQLHRWEGDNGTTII